MRILMDQAPPALSAYQLGWLDDGPVGNIYTWAIEIHNAGDGRDPYEPGQMQNLVLMAAALCELTGMHPNRWWGHKNVTRRKPDPAGLDMQAFCEAVAVCLFVGPEGALPTPTPEEEEMELEYVLEMHEFYLSVKRTTTIKTERQSIDYWLWLLLTKKQTREGMRVAMAEVARTNGSL